MDGSPPDSLLDQASEYIEKLTEKISQQRTEAERLELTIKEQGAIIDEMTVQQQTIRDLETTIEVMTLDLESRSDTIVFLSSLVVKLHEHLTRLSEIFGHAAQDSQVQLEFEKLFSEISRMEKAIHDTAIPGVCANSPGAPIVSPDDDCTKYAKISESTVHFFPSHEDNDAAHAEKEEIPPEDSELHYYKRHCQALEQQITILRTALLSQEETSRKVASSVCSLPLSHYKHHHTTAEPLPSQSFRHDVLLKMLQWVNAEIQKSPRPYLNNAFSQEFSACLRAVAMGASVSSQPLPRFPEAFALLMSGV